MNTARELTELAAKAVGDYQDYTWEENPFFAGLQRRNFDLPEDGGLELQPSEWAPLEDVSDALRLAVQLRMNVQINELSVVVYLPQDELGNTPPPVFEYPDEKTGHLQATQRAIVRAAAQRAKEMGHA
jgi:hypothetical protein